MLILSASLETMQRTPNDGEVITLVPKPGAANVDMAWLRVRNCNWLVNEPKFREIYAELVDIGFAHAEGRAPSCVVNHSVHGPVVKMGEPGSVDSWNTWRSTCEAVLDGLDRESVARMRSYFDDLWHYWDKMRPPNQIWPKTFAAPRCPATTTAPATPASDPDAAAP